MQGAAAAMRSDAIAEAQGSRKNANALLRAVAKKRGKAKDKFDAIGSNVKGARKERDRARKERDAARELLRMLRAGANPEAPVYRTPPEQQVRGNPQSGMPGVSVRNRTADRERARDIAAAKADLVAAKGEIRGAKEAIGTGKAQMRGMLEPVGALGKARAEFDNVKAIRDLARQQMMGLQKLGPGQIALSNQDELVRRLEEMGYDTSKLDPYATMDALGASFDSSTLSAERRARNEAIPVDDQHRATRTGMTPAEVQRARATPEYQSMKAELDGALREKRLDINLGGKGGPKWAEGPALNRDTVDEFVRLAMAKYGRMNVYKLLMDEYKELFPKAMPMTAAGAPPATSPTQG